MQTEHFDTDHGIATAIVAGMRLAKKDIIRDPSAKHGAAFIVLRDSVGNERLEKVEDVQARPESAAGTRTFGDIVSFAHYWKDHATEDSRIYCKVDKNASGVSFAAVFDEHGKGGPGWREHRAVLTPAPSAEWDSWRARNKQAFKGNVAFAEWIEDCVPDFVKPAGADMLQIALTMSISENLTFSNPTRLDNGQTELTFNKIVSGSAGGSAGKVKIPTEFEIAIPIFDMLGAKKYAMKARLKYRLTDGGLVIFYELDRPHVTLRLATVDLLMELTNRTSATVLIGSPD